ncbi:MAG: hypothetical protein DYG94_06880 [Leptolyngbya sp. PLA3]|nr:MAG: hypothetical protein EDM82_06225 [Cyanobacteria bacterium CYA]MCE7968452.1 hypothetical protein [Leptolyngbya sp. PL-A3]
MFTSSRTLGFEWLALLVAGEDVGPGAGGAENVGDGGMQRAGADVEALVELVVRARRSVSAAIRSRSCRGA